MLLFLAVLLMSFTPGKKPSLKEAVASQDITKMKEQLDAGADPNEKDAGYPMIYWAAYWGNSEMIKLLASKGADVNMPGQLGITALYQLIYDGEEPAALLEKNKKINENLLKAYKGDTAKVVKWLKHQDINRFSTVVDKVKTLLDLGADFNALQGNGEIKVGTPLIAAVEKQRVEIVKMLVEKGADVNLGLKREEFGVQVGTDVMKTVKFIKPLDKAIETGNKDIEGYLISKGATKSSN
jgi:ankyrin repeat protein